MRYVLFLLLLFVLGYVQSSSPTEVEVEEVEVELQKVEVEVVVVPRLVVVPVAQAPENDGRERLLVGMRALASTENVSLDRLSARYRWDVELVADLALAFGAEFNVEPALLVALSWTESRWNPRETHDRGRGCGITGILHDRRGRPSCDELYDPAVSFDWTARRLAALTSPNGAVLIAPYNGGGKKAQRYEAKIRRRADVVRRAQRKELK